jgi:hypothetical protein
MKNADSCAKFSENIKADNCRKTRVSLNNMALHTYLSEKHQSRTLPKNQGLKAAQDGLFAHKTPPNPPFVLFFRKKIF